MVKKSFCVPSWISRSQYFGTQFKIVSLDAKKFNSTIQQKVSSFVLCSKSFSQKFPFSAILTQTFDLLIVAVIFDFIALIAIRYHQATHRHSEELDLNTTTVPKISKKSKIWWKWKQYLMIAVRSIEAHVWQLSWQNEEILWQNVRRMEFNNSLSDRVPQFSKKSPKITFQLHERFLTAKITNIQSSAYESSNLWQPNSNFYK